MIGHEKVQVVKRGFMTLDMAHDVSCALMAFQMEDHFYLGGEGKLGCRYSMLSEPHLKRW